MDQKKIFNLRVHGIEIVEKSLNNITPENLDLFNFQTRVQSIIDPDQQLMVTFVAVEVQNINNRTPLGKLMAGFGYLIDDFKNMFEVNDKGQYIIPTELEIALKSISLSTMRGLMFSEFRGTHLHKAILPMINPDTFEKAEGNLIEETKTIQPAVKPKKKK